MSPSFTPDFTLKHIGINAENEAEARKTAELFSAMFGFPVKIGNSSVFASSCIEVMKSPFRGRMGHIAFETADVEAAERYLGEHGFAIDPSTIKTDEQGVHKFVYLADEVGGFAIHLIKRA